jgi:hypothetical protein
MLHATEQEIGGSDSAAHERSHRKVQATCKGDINRNKTLAQDAVTHRCCCSGQFKWLKIFRQREQKKKFKATTKSNIQDVNEERQTQGIIDVE